MTKVKRRILYIGIALPAIWGLMVLESRLMEPVYAEREAKKFLQERSLALEQFSGPEFRARPPNGFNAFVWVFKDSNRIMELEAFPYGDLICLYESFEDGSRKAVCQLSDGGENHIVESIIPPGNPLVVAP